MNNPRDITLQVHKKQMISPLLQVFMILRRFLDYSQSQPIHESMPLRFTLW